jgi:hypothetical protein
MPTAHGQEVKNLNVVPVTEDYGKHLMKRLLAGKPSIDVFTKNSKLTIKEVEAVTQLSPSVANAVRNLQGCTTNTLPRNDDGSTGAITLPFSITFSAGHSQKLTLTITVILRLTDLWKRSRHLVWQQLIHQSSLHFSLTWIREIQPPA